MRLTDRRHGIAVTLSALLLCFLPLGTGKEASLGDAFEAPTEAKDQHGNPVKKGTDEKTGWPLEIRHKATGMHLVFIPAGEFQMGSPDKEDGREEVEGPVHKVKITRPFYLGKYEVMQAEWQKVMDNNPSKFKGDTNPVEQASWHDCQEFMKKLNDLVRSARYSGSSSAVGTPRGEEPPEGGTTNLAFALPTEAQWEYACRAGTTTRFSFGDQDSGLGKSAWYSGNADFKTHPAGGKDANPWGLYDMHGNVWEWCRDAWHTSYGGAPADESAWATGGDPSRRVLRGGSWLNHPGNLRSALRFRSPVGTRFFIFGVRAALDLK